MTNDPLTGPINLMTVQQHNWLYRGKVTVVIDGVHMCVFRAGSERRRAPDLASGRLQSSRGDRCYGRTGQNGTLRRFPEERSRHLDVVVSGRSPAARSLVAAAAKLCSSF